MELTQKQKEGLEIAVARYHERKPWTCIAGYAGTGKSTLIKFIISSLNLNEERDVCYVTFTGKASLVLREKGCKNACTAHKLLYKSYPRSDGTFYHAPRKIIPNYKLIVVDEVSMLPKNIWDLLLSHKIHVIALGDPGQLPPIGDDNEILKTPHVFLDEIMRQAKESEIIQLTMDIRAGKPLKLFQGQEVQIIDKKDLVSGMLLWADQIICAKNETRKNINNLMRTYLHGDNAKKNILLDGDKVICLRNYWDIFSEHGDVLVNGSIGYVYDISERKSKHPLVKNYLSCDFLPEFYSEEEAEDSFFDLYFRRLGLDKKLLKDGEATVNKTNFKRIPQEEKPFEFDYGYCITCWKAQGSEFDKVLVFEEDFPFNKDEHIRYLYTAATRARKKLIIVRK